MPKFTPLELLEVVPWQFDEPEARLWAVARIKELEDKLGRRSWQPIATAPKNGERVIIAKIASSSMDYGGGGMPPHVWFAVTASHNGRYWTDGLDKLVEPTHWMELPEVPSGD